MKTSKEFTRMVDFQQMAFDNTFNLMKTVQNQLESLMNLSMKQNPWLPGDGKKFCTYWADTCQKGMADYKEFMDANLAKAREMFEAPTKPASETSPKPAKKS